MTIDPAAGALAMAVCALLFGTAALHKLAALREFATVFASYDLLPQRWARRTFIVVPAWEALIAASVLLPPARRLAAVGGAVTLLTYAVVIAYSLRRGRSDLMCGCAGVSDQRIGPAMVWRNAVLAAVCCCAALPWLPRQWTGTDWVTMACGLAAALALYWCSEELLMPDRASSNAVTMRAAAD